MAGRGTPEQVTDAVLRRLAPARGAQHLGDVLSSAAKPLALVLDDLDEDTDPEVWKRFFEPLRAIPGVRLVVGLPTSSRIPFPGATTYDLDDRSDESAEDIRGYLALQIRLAAPQAPEPQGSKAVDTLAPRVASEWSVATTVSALPRIAPEESSVRRYLNEATTALDAAAYRLSDVARFMAERGLAIDPSWVAAGPPTEGGGRDALEAILTDDGFAMIHAIGRRKEAVCRVYVKPGSGKWDVNGRTLGDYFPRPVLVTAIQQAFVATDTLGRYDVKANVDGGGQTGQAGALRLARRNRAVYHLNPFYRHLEPVRRFLAAAAVLRGRGPFLFIDATSAIQVLYPLLDVLARALGGPRPWALGHPLPDEPEVTALAARAQPYRVLQATVAGVPLTLRVQNQMDPSDGDNHALLWHRLALGTEDGVLALADTHGPVLWHPRLYAPRDEHGRLRSTGPGTEHLDEPATSPLEGSEAPTHREVFDLLWPRALERALTGFAEDVRAGTDSLARGQFELGVCRLWHDTTTRLGRPEIIRPDPPRPLTAAELGRTALEETP